MFYNVDLKPSDMRHTYVYNCSIRTAWITWRNIAVLQKHTNKSDRTWQLWGLHAHRQCVLAVAWMHVRFSHNKNSETKYIRIVSGLTENNQTQLELIYEKVLPAVIKHIARIEKLLVQSRTMLIGFRLQTLKAHSGCKWHVIALWQWVEELYVRFYFVFAEDFRVLTCYTIT